MNPRLDLLQPYPFEKLRVLFAQVKPADKPAISFGIGEPKHPTPEFIKQALAESLAGLANYPTTAGSDALRQCIASWLERRYGLPKVNATTEVLPVTGSREALFAFAQTVVDGTRAGALVLCPNPFYQIYEGAALLAGATPVFANSDPARNFAPAFDRIADEVWQKVQLLFVCTPGNPTGAVLSLEDWKQLFALSDRYGFVIASDECYSEIYFDEGRAPLGALEAAHKLGRGLDRLVMFSSLSKRSNVPGLRSGFVAGDAALLKKFLLYRTYHGGAMNPAVQSASIAAWNDESHVRENRAAYVRKFSEVTPMLAEVLDVALPDAGFYLWADVSRTGLTDTEFAARLLAEQNVTVLPGSYLAREADGINPGANRVRMALVATPEECLEGARRIVEFCKSLA
ncbi:succinyldiaminopimelate transaminase [Cupriavidus necator]|uniref:Aminotransferase, class I and II n=1 Tax=Cupriavidus necator (strain ATCC 17699 / DSM 428 / KCTC 22496 / NCIMB 10442 / H16 / Stanier 337) TaxID=381666 RepID=Q0KA06_CUPNH|nr:MULTISPECIES: succinyldiaminopimelate transaminase [Cupriavidus]EON16610.1 succinyldiaminopimelate transaminase [Cupriavidus sp. GA3-3]KUE86903.1 succinyldiaminopimelate transaminase [Cupriavidus necator]QCC00989.1 succinyldiaminopimelate transaminase [Cupriavidus necator H16]QQB76184.1 succinyldiaminopimelate transaminase [Cupriavidus necator]WKA39359.1 succinyldiaminopimelate transaminase [Cupriavidus necator]